MCLYLEISLFLLFNKLFGSYKDISNFWLGQRSQLTLVRLKGNQCLELFHLILGVKLAFLSFILGWRAQFHLCSSHIWMILIIWCFLHDAFCRHSIYKSNLSFFDPVTYFLVAAYMWYASIFVSFSYKLTIVWKSLKLRVLVKFL